MTIFIHAPFVSSTFRLHGNKKIVWKIVRVGLDIGSNIGLLLPTQNLKPPFLKTNFLYRIYEVV